MPTIEAYKFGEIVIDGKTYREDVIILPDRVIPHWWRKEGHSLDPADLTAVIAARPTTFIMGCGANGVLTVPEKTVRFLAEQGITLIAQRSGEAVATFKAMAGERVACGVHLTC